MAKPAAVGKKDGKGVGSSKRQKSSGKPALAVKPVETKSIGQLTSHIANKQKRSEAYAKLKHKKQVRSQPVIYTCRFA